MSWYFYVYDDFESTFKTRAFLKIDSTTISSLLLEIDQGDTLVLTSIFENNCTWLSPCRAHQMTAKWGRVPARSTKQPVNVSFLHLSSHEKLRCNTRFPRLRPRQLGILVLHGINDTFSRSVQKTHRADAWVVRVKPCWNLEKPKNTSRFGIICEGWHAWHKMIWETSHAWHRDV